LYFISRNVQEKGEERDALDSDGGDNVVWGGREKIPEFFSRKFSPNVQNVYTSVT